MGFEFDWRSDWHFYENGRLGECPSLHGPMEQCKIRLCLGLGVGILGFRAGKALLFPGNWESSFLGLKGTCRLLILLHG